MRHHVWNNHKRYCHTIVIHRSIASASPIKLGGSLSRSLPVFALSKNPGAVRSWLSVLPIQIQFSQRVLEQPAYGYSAYALSRFRTSFAQCGRPPRNPSTVAVCSYICHHGYLSLIPTFRRIMLTCVLLASWLPRWEPVRRKAVWTITLMLIN
jgi:hypothetical protein